MSRVEKGQGFEPAFSTLLIIGAGMSGISTAAKFKHAYGDDYVIYERQKELGGTWWMNTYPGCGVDIPTLLYSFSFQHKYDWSAFFALQPEIQEYINQTAIKWGIKPQIRFSTDAESCEWIEETKRWRVRLRRRRANLPWALDDPTDEELQQEEKGDTWVHECKILFSCVGPMMMPRKCETPGWENFKGDMFHSARWDHRVDHRGKDVIVIGNGCSAAQLVPAILPEVKSVTQFARSAQWMMPRPPPPIFGTNENFRKYANMVYSWTPWLYTLSRFLIFSVHETEFAAYKTTKSGEKKRLRSEKALGDYMKSLCPKKYHDIVLPRFPLGCKRRVVNDGYLESLHRENMLLTTDPIDHIEEHGVVTKSGKRYHADLIVLAHGFYAGLRMLPLMSNITGRDGITLEQHFKELGGPTAYKTMAFHGFPNFFMTSGPNSATGYTSILVAIETVGELAMKVMAPVIKGHADSIEVKKGPEIAYRDWIEKSHKDSVWSNEYCRSWYVTETGKNSLSYPFSQAHMVWDLRRPERKDWIVGYTSRTIRRRKILNISYFVLLSAMFGLAVWGKRKSGGAREVLEMVIDHARGWYGTLSVGLRG